jgi:formate hydrogenlyase transcriptional activator
MQILWNRESYSWPGNIRVLVSSQPASPSSQAVSTAQPSLPLTEILLSQEKEIIESALAAGKGKIARPNGAAAKLGIPRSTLGSKNQTAQN